MSATGHSLELTYLLYVQRHRRYELKQTLFQRPFSTVEYVVSYRAANFEGLRRQCGGNIWLETLGVENRKNIRFVPVKTDDQPDLQGKSLPLVPVL